jgi:hypothetical protein
MRWLPNSMSRERSTAYIEKIVTISAEISLRRPEQNCLAPHGISGSTASKVAQS